MAYWCGRPPSLRLPLAVAGGLLTRAARTWLVFDASTVHQLAPDEHAIYQALLELPTVATQVPAGESADRTLLETAKAAGGCIVSRDRFREHRRRFRSIVGHSDRCLDGWVANDRIIVPGLDLDVVLPESAAVAWAQVQRHVVTTRPPDAEPARPETAA